MGVQIGEAYDLLGTQVAVEHLRALQAETPTIDKWVADFRALSGITGGVQQAS
jgi:hypothetical protein